MTLAHIYVSTGAFRTRSLPCILEICDHYKIINIELSSGLDFTPGQQELVRRYGERFRYLVHNYFPPHQESFVLNLASNDPGIFRRTSEHCRAAIDLCAEIGAPFYSVHAGTAIDPHPEDLGHVQTHLKRASLEQAYSVFINNVCTLGEYAANRGIRLLIENHVVAPFNLVNGQNVFLLGATASDLKSLISDVSHPNIGLLIDVGHLKVTAHILGFDPYVFIEQVASHIEAFHLSDNDGQADTNRPFDSSAWFIEVLRGFPKATLVIEAYRLDECEIIACRDELVEALAL